jgi:uncharacterized protein involved in response to NO
MAETPPDQSRVPTHAHHEGPVILQQGFRPFFLLAAIWAALAMALWMASLNGLPALPGAIDALAWHKHEMLFGFAAAAMAGFILTAVLYFPVLTMPRVRDD